MYDIYCLDHVFEADDYFEEIRHLGLFSTEEKAKLALEGICNDAFLTNCPKNFSSFRFEINKYSVDEIASWAEGFFSYGDIEEII